MGKSFYVKSIISAVCGFTGGIVLSKTLLKKGFSTKTIRNIGISCLVVDSVLITSAIHGMVKMS